MRLNNLTKSVVLTFLLSFSVSAQGLIFSIADKSNAGEISQPVAFYPSSRNERFFIQALRTICGAQMTYQATTGYGNFGSLSQLAQAGLINEALASGSIYGYNYVVSAQARTATTLTVFEIVAVPWLYRKTGVRSFFVETDSIIKGADKQGAAANRNDPTIEEEYICYSVTECEESAIRSLRMLHSAQMTYQATSGYGNYGSLCELGENNLIAKILAQGSRFGYYFVVLKRNGDAQKPASLEIRAIPHNYPITGRRSFFIGTEGVILGADRAGAPVNSDAPAIGY